MRRLVAGRRSRRAGDRGLTLIELAVAVLVLSLGTVAALRVGDQTARATAEELPRLAARIAAMNTAQNLRLDPAAQPQGLVVVLDQTVTLSVDRGAAAAGLVQATVTATTRAGPGAQLAVHLPGPAMP